MIVSARHRPAWKRHGPNELRLLRLYDAVLDEQGRWPRGSDPERAIGRASRAIWTAVEHAADGQQ